MKSTIYQATDALSVAGVLIVKTHSDSAIRNSLNAGRGNGKE